MGYELLYTRQDRRNRRVAQHLGEGLRKTWVAGGVLLSLFGLGMVSGTAARGSTGLVPQRGLYWTHVAAEKVLYEEGLEWRTGVDVVAYARCFGEGRFIRGKHRVKFFKRFRCYIQPVAAEDYVFGNDPYWITFQVIGPRDWDYEMRDPGP